MKRTIVVLALIALAGSIGLNCGGSGGGGGGLLGSAAKYSGESWDAVVMVNGLTACSQGLAGMGAGLAPFTAGLFPGLEVKNDGYEYKADVPEVKVLAYFVIAPGVVAAGDSVRVRFRFQAAADGADGDYFLARIIDGERFRSPAEARRGEMKANQPVAVNYGFRASSDSLALMFIVGLSSPADAFYLDDLQVTLKGAPFITDNFEAGSYTAPAPLSASVMRFPFLPLYPTGTIAPAATVVLEGTQSLKITGGRFFQLYGQYSTSQGVTGAFLDYVGSNPLIPFFGQTQALRMGGMYLGDYMGFDNATLPTCTERGNALFAIKPSGNADLSGHWTLRLNAACQEPGVFIGETIADVPPFAAGDPVSIFRNLLIFGGYPFATADGDLIDSVLGTSMGTAGMMMLQSTGEGTEAQLIGNYDPTTGVFAGQIMGALPAAGANTCTVTAGQFMAFIDKSAPIPPP